MLLQLFKFVAVVLILQTIPQTHGKGIGIIYHPYYGYPLDYMASVFNETFGGVGVWDTIVNAGGPDVAWMSQWDAIFTFADGGYCDTQAQQDALGDNLKTYCDNGGAVVIAGLDGVGDIGNTLGGSFHPAYSIFNYSRTVFDFFYQERGTMNAFNWPFHPITRGVTTFTDSAAVLYYALLPSGVTNDNLVPGAYSVLQWTSPGGYRGPFVAVRDKVGPKKVSVVFLGWWPPSYEDVQYGYYWSDPNDFTGQSLKKLVLQSLAYVINNKPFLQPETITTPCAGPEGITLNMYDVFWDNASFYGFFPSYKVVDQSPSSNTILEAGKNYTITYTAANTFPYPISGSTYAVVPTCPPSSNTDSAASTLSLSPLHWLLGLTMYFL